MVRPRHSSRLFQFACLHIGRKGIALGALWLGLSGLRGQTSRPIDFASGFSGDIILGASEADPGHNIAVSNWFFYETGATPPHGAVAQGLPAGGAFTVGGRGFQFADFTGNNVLTSAGTLTLTSPASFQDLHFLVTAQGGSGSGAFNVTLNFSDSSSTQTSNFTGIKDWTLESNGGANNALLGVGLLSGSSSTIYTGNLYLLVFDYSLAPGDQSKTLDSISIGGISGVNTLMFFGASGTTAIPEPAAWAAIFGITALGIVGSRAYRRRKQARLSLAASRKAAGLGTGRDS